MTVTRAARSAERGRMDVSLRSQVALPVTKPRLGEGEISWTGTSTVTSGEPLIQMRCGDPSMSSSARSRSVVLRRDVAARNSLGSDESDWNDLARRRVEGLSDGSRGHRHPADLRLLVVDRPALGGCWFGAELSRSFDIDYFSITRHKRLFEAGGNAIALPRALERCIPTLSTRITSARTSGNGEIVFRATSWRSRKPCTRNARSISVSVYGSYLEFEPTTSTPAGHGDPRSAALAGRRTRLRSEATPIPERPDPTIGSVDVHLTSTRRAVAWYLEEARQPRGFPGVDADAFRPSGAGRSLDVAFVGDAYGTTTDGDPNLGAIRGKRALLREELALGSDRRSGGGLRGCQGGIGFGYTGRSKTNTCLKGRDFEATSAGAAYLTTFNPELAPLFNIGSEIACYRQLDELPTTVIEMLADPDRLLEMGVRARHRVVAQHTWTRRVAQLLRWLGLAPDEVTLVTVALPVRNCADTVRQAVLSILSQTYETWTLLLIDDGSTDGTLRAVEDLSADERIRVLSDGRSLGLAARLNQAIELSTGTYLARMDGDDIAYPERLELQVHWLEAHPDIDLLGAPVVVFGASGEPRGWRPCPPDHPEICASPNSGFPMAHPTWCGRRAWFDRFRYDVRAIRMEDQDLLLRKWRHSRFANLPDIVLGYREERVDLRKLLRSRRYFVRSVAGAEHGWMKPGTIRAGVEQSAKGLADSAAVLLGIESWLLSHRQRPLAEAQLARWLEIWQRSTDPRG